MPDINKQAELAVEKLLQAEEDQLYEQLGIRAKAMAEDPRTGSFFEPSVTYDQAKMGLKEDVLEFGKRLFNRWTVEAHKLICGSDPEDQKDREDLVNAFNVTPEKITAVLAVLLVTHLGLSPAIAIIVAALVIKRFFRPAYNEFCQLWEKNLPDVV
jgi:hypothetical protein